MNDKLPVKAPETRDSTSHDLSVPEQLACKLLEITCMVKGLYLRTNTNDLSSLPSLRDIVREDMLQFMARYRILLVDLWGKCDLFSTWDFLLEYLVKRSTAIKHHLEHMPVGNSDERNQTLTKT